MGCGESGKDCAAEGSELLLSTADGSFGCASSTANARRSGSRERSLCGWQQRQSKTRMGVSCNMRSWTYRACIRIDDKSKSWQRCDEYDFLHCERQIPHCQVISRQKRLRAYHFIILLCPPQLQFPLSSHDILKETRKGSSFGARICRIRHSERHLAPPATSRNPRHAHPKNHHRATYIGHQKCERRHSTQKSMIRRTAFQRWRTNLDEK